jgi:hypothetical protein
MLLPVTALFLLAGEARRADTAALKLELRASETTILVGQPTKVSILLTATSEMPVHPEAVRLLISRSAPESVSDPRFHAALARRACAVLF